MGSLSTGGLLFTLFLHLAQCTTTRYFTYEEDAPGTQIGNLSEDLKIDPAEDPDTSFRFMQESNSSVIQMREIDGLLSVAERIDREQLCPRTPRCFIAFDIVAFSKEKFQLIHVEIEVKDINDHAPVFPRNETHIEIVENVPVNSRFPLDIALDQDVGENYIESYNISESTHFAIEVRDRDDGVKFAELVLIQELDREVEDFYTLEVTASDGGMPAQSGSVTVFIKVLDFNDNSPTFEHTSLKVELNEDSPVGHRVLRVHAFDPDDGVNGEVTYAFADGLSPEALQLFHIDPYSGDVTLKSLVDYEKRKSYELHIKASDLGVNSMPSSCKVVIDVVDVNDNAPEITIKPMTSTSDGVAYITEAAAAESFVALISTADRDSGSNGYVHVSLLGHEHFTLQQAYGDTFMIITTTTLDREKIPEYNLTVVAEDLGSPPFKTVRQYTIRVTDENDNAPLFSKSLYEVGVIENNIPGSYVMTVVARDPDVAKNAKVSYKLIDSEVPGGSPVSTYVSVDSLTGSLYTLRSFDYETIKQLELVIQAEDSGSPSLSSTSTIRIKVVDQNDNTPYFTFPILVNDSADIALPFNAPAGYLALRVAARDEDDGVNSKLSYQMVQGDPKLFTINKETGEIILKQFLTAEIGDVLEMQISVRDNGRSPLSSTASVRFIVSDTEASEDRILIVLGTSDEEGPDLDGSLIIIIVLSGGCALLLIAIVVVALTCKLSCGTRSRIMKRDPCEGLFTSPSPIMDSTSSNIYTGHQSFYTERTSSSLDDSCLYEEKSTDSETKMFLPSKRFQPASVWQGDKYSIQVSGIGSTDQQSMKDSGKGDSDFNDSDSDISGDGRRSFSTFHPRMKSTSSGASSLCGEGQGSYCAVPSQNMRTARDSSYTTMGFPPAPVFCHPQGYPAAGYGTNLPKSRSSMYTFTRTGTLPSYFSQQHRQAAVGNIPIQKPGTNIVTVASAYEVATMF